MKFKLRMRGLESEGLTRRIVERKLRFALGRFQASPPPGEPNGLQRLKLRNETRRPPADRGS